MVKSFWAVIKTFLMKYLDIQLFFSENFRINGLVLKILDTLLFLSEKLP